MRYIIQRINKDLPIKLTSALLALLLWFIVLNINNPYKDKTFFVELDIKNENVLLEKNLYLVNKNYRKTVEVIVRGREDAINNINPADFYAELDFSKVKSVNDKSVGIDGPFYAKNDKQVTIIGMSPKNIGIELENIARSDFIVNLELKGIPKASYKVISAKTEPDMVTIQDRESVVNTIHEVKALVDVNNIDRDRKVIKQPCSVYNENGEEITSLSNNFTVDVFLEVAKEVPVIPDIQGEPAKDYLYTGYETSAGKVLVTGHFEALAGLSGLKTGQIQIEGINETTAYNVPIQLPEGVKLFGMENSVIVTVQIEKLQEREFEIDKEDIAIRNMDILNKYIYEIITQDEKVVLKGRQAYLDSIDIRGLMPYIDVGGLLEGNHQLKLHVNPYPEVEILQLPDIEVTVTRPQEDEPGGNTEEQVSGESEANNEGNEEGGGNEAGEENEESEGNGENGGNDGKEGYEGNAMKDEKNEKIRMMR